MGILRTRQKISTELHIENKREEEGKNVYSPDFCFASICYRLGSKGKKT